MSHVDAWTFKDAMDAPLAEGDVLLWWLGQAGFLVRSADEAVLIDPYLTTTGSRRFPPPFGAADAVGVDAVLVTHEHGDHLDLDVVQAFSEVNARARWVVPEPVAPQLARLGVDPELIVPAQPGQRHEFGRLIVQPIAAHHGAHMADAYGTGEAISGGLVRFLGYVVELAGTRIYHSGDCLAYPGLAEELIRLAVDVVLLPINGRDAEREARDIVGNMSAEEAVVLAARAGAEVLIPMHWDLFEGNLGDPSQVVTLAERDHPGLTVLLPSKHRPFGLHRIGKRPVPTGSSPDRWSTSVIH